LANLERHKDPDTFSGSCAEGLADLAKMKLQNALLEKQVKELATESLSLSLAAHDTDSNAGNKLGGENSQNSSQ